MITLTIGKTKKHPVDTSRYMTDTRQISATLKENVDIKAPIFKVSFDTSNYNYIAWSRDDGPTRYYWIDNTVYIHNNIFEIHCSLDLMATYYNVIQHGLTGKLLYSTYEMDWDEYFDDLRFSPSSLDVYDYLEWGDESNNWLHESANVFGDAANIWDIDYDEHGKIIGYGEGCYLAQIQNNSGISTYLYNQAGFNQFMADMLSMWNTQWSGPFSTVDPRSFIKLCVWMPIDPGNLVEHIPGSLSDHATWYLGSKTIGAPDPSQGEYSWQIPYTTILSFDGGIDVPHHAVEHPTWMENSRWNTLTLSTPSGNTEINLDMMYPVSNQHDHIYFNTIFDVVQGRINTKYTFDVKGGWSNISGTPIYESDFQVGWDVMALIQSVFNYSQGLINSAITGAGLAAAAFTGGMSLGSGLAKEKAPAQAKPDMADSIRAVESGTADVSPTTLMMARHNSSVASSSNNQPALAGVVTGAVAASKLFPKINNSVNNITTVGNRASFFNTQQLGVISLRLKPFRCKELAYTEPSISEYPTPKEKYIHYCEQFGYPANKFIRNLYLNGQPGTLYVFEDAHLDLSDVNTLELNGITDEEMQAIEQIAKSGFWYNVN